MARATTVVATTAIPVAATTRVTGSRAATCTATIRIGTNGKVIRAAPIMARAVMAAATTALPAAAITGVTGIMAAKRDTTTRIGNRGTATRAVPTVTEPIRGTRALHT